MSSFRDEVYENLDYLSQLTEVIISPQNEALGKLPNRLELDFNTINRNLKNRYESNPAFDLSPESIINSLNVVDSQTHISQISKCFEFEMSDDFAIDFVNKTTSGSLALVKKVNQLDDRTVIKLAINKAMSHLTYHNWPARQCREKIITVLNLFQPNSGTEWAKNLVGQPYHEGKAAICSALEKNILENEWRIRDAVLIEKIGLWIQVYLEGSKDSDISLVNLMKLKMMASKDVPIYSMSEISNVNSL